MDGAKEWIQEQEEKLEGWAKEQGNDAVDGIFEEKPSPQTSPPQTQPQVQTQQISPPHHSTDKQKVAEAQDLLNRLGYDAGTVDGIYGSKTRMAIQAFQADRNLPQHGNATDELLARLAQEAPPVAPIVAESLPSAPQTMPAVYPLGGSSPVAPDAAPGQGGAPTDAGPLIAPALPGASPVPADGTAGEAGAATASALLAGATPSQDYAALAARHGLHLAGGLPVIGGGRDVLTDEETKAVAKFLDYVELGLDPGFIDDSPVCWASTHLPKDAWEAYLDKRGRVWNGEDEFEKGRTRQAFLDDHAAALRDRAVSLPLEAVVVDEMTLRSYDTASGGYNLGFDDLNSHAANFDTLGSYLGAVVPRAACYGDTFTFSPAAVTLPEIWALDPAEAEAVIGRLNNRKIYIAYAFRFRPIPLAKVENRNRPSDRVPVWSEITSVSLYEDADLERPIATIPLNMGKAPVLLAGMPDTAQPAPEPFLNDITVALLLLRDHGDVLGPEAWHKLMQHQARSDAAYYDRRLDPRTGAIVHHTRMTGSYDPRYVPFFPNRFEGDWQSAFPEAQVAQFKRWMMLQAHNLPDALMLRVRAERTGSQDARNIVLPVVEADRLPDDFPLIAQGYSTNQILRLNEDPTGTGRNFDFDLISGATTSRAAALILPGIAADYIPELTAEESAIVSEAMSWDASDAEIAVGTVSSTIVRLDEETELVAIAATPTRLVVRDRDGTVVFEKAYEAVSLDPNRLDSATLVTALPDGKEPYLTAEIVDLLVVRHQPDAVSDEHYDQMMVARWAYEASVPPDEGDPDWGRFFVPGKPEPTDAQRAALLERFKSWTAERAAALPDRFRMHYRISRLNDGNPVSVEAPYSPQNFDSRVPAQIVRNCQSEARSHPALTPACDYLESTRATAPDIHPFGFGHAKGGPRLACSTALPDHRDPYCKAREAQLVAIGGRDYEPGYRDVFVLDKEIFFTGTEGEMTSLRSGTPNLLLEIGIAGIRVADGPLPRPFDVARERYDAYRQALGLRDDGWRDPEAPPSRTTFVFETILHSATLLKNKTHEPIVTFELRDARVIDLAALTVPDNSASVPDAPFGPDIVGLRLGMTFEEADEIIRDHMKVAQVLVLDRAHNTNALSGDFERFSSNRIYLAENSSEFIILYDEPPSAPGVVLGITRQINLPHGLLVPAAALAQLREKYGKEDFTGNYGMIGWGKGLRPTSDYDPGADNCLPSSGNRSTRDWVDESGAQADWSTGSQWAVPNMTLYSSVTGRVCGPIVSMQFETTQDADRTDRLVLHLIEPNLYDRHYENSRQLVESGAVALGAEATGPELKL